MPTEGGFMGLTGKGLMKGLVYVVVALVVLGIVKTAVPDIWAKIPGLKEF
jgi:hypothetical protein